MPRLYPVHGTKQFPRGRECLTYSFKADGQIIVDRIRPRDHMEMVARLWGAFGKGSIRMMSRRMERGETYVDMPELGEPEVA